VIKEINMFFRELYSCFDRVLLFLFGRLTDIARYKSDDPNGTKYGILNARNHA